MRLRRWNRYCGLWRRGVGLGSRFVGRGSLYRRAYWLVCTGIWNGLAGYVHSTCQSSCPDRLRAYTEDHGELVDHHLGTSQMVDTVEHIRALEFAPLHIMEIEAPDDGHHDVCRRSNPILSLDSRGTRINPGYQRNGSNIKFAKPGFTIALFLVLIASQGKVRNVDGVANDDYCQPGCAWHHDHMTFYYRLYILAIAL